MVKIIMHGCNGHMGQVISQLVKDDPAVEIVAGVDVTDNRENGYPVFTDLKDCDVQADAMIDFSSFRATDGVLEYCRSRQLPLVLCTTGLTPEQVEKVQKTSEEVAVLRSANMSLGINTLLKLIQEDLPMDCVFAFTAQEEVGTRGAFGAAFAVTPEIAVVLEGTTAADSPKMEPHRKVCHPGRGPVLSLMDGGAVYDRELFERLRTLAEERDIPWQVKHYLSGGTDAKAMQRTKSGVRVTGISAAVRYLHAPASVASLKDMEHIYALCKALIESLAQERE